MTNEAKFPTRPTRAISVTVASRTTQTDSRGNSAQDQSEHSSKSSDYDRMGQAIGNIVVECSKSQYSNETVEGTIPTIVVQEGGYELSAVPSAAADVLLGMAMAMGG